MALYNQKKIKNIIIIIWERVYESYYSIKREKPQCFYDLVGFSESSTYVGQISRKKMRRAISLCCVRGSKCFLDGYG